MRSAKFLGCVAAAIVASIGAAAGAAHVDLRPGYPALSRLPDWNGVWSPGVGAGSRIMPKPALTPAAAKALADYEAAKGKGENLQTDAANCVPNGMPQIMRTPYPMEILFTPGQVTILIETYSQVRRIFTDGRKLPDDPDPYFNGHSVGHWEGDTLVADTNGISPLVSILPGVHATEKTTIRERIRLEAPDRLVDEITVTDPDVFTQPFVIHAAYARKDDWEMREYVCQENNKDAADPFGRPSMKLD